MVHIVLPLPRVPVLRCPVIAGATLQNGHQQHARLLLGEPVCPLQQPALRPMAGVRHVAACAAFEMHAVFMGAPGCSLQQPAQGLKGFTCMASGTAGFEQAEASAWYDTAGLEQC